MDLATYNLQPGQRLSDLAGYLGMSTTDLARLNPQKARILVPGVGEVFADPIEGEPIYGPSRPLHAAPTTLLPTAPRLAPAVTALALHGASLGIAGLPSEDALWLGDTTTGTTTTGGNPTINVSTGSIVGLVLLGVAITAGVGALIGVGVAALVAGGKPPAYGKGAAIGAAGGLLAAVLLPRNS